jgi:hypothetical protein
MQAAAYVPEETAASIFSSEVNIHSSACIFRVDVRMEAAGSSKRS